MSEKSAEEIENANFMVHYHHLRVKESDSNPFLSASYKRKCAAQYFHASLALLDNEATCQILEDKLLPYMSLVDDRSERGINNYADSAIALASSAGRNDVSKWKSQIRNTRPVSEVIKKLTDCRRKCHELNITEEDVSIFAKQLKKQEGDQMQQTDIKVEQLSNPPSLFPNANVPKKQNNTTTIFMKAPNGIDTDIKEENEIHQPEDTYHSNFSEGRGRSSGFQGFQRFQGDSNSDRGWSAGFKGCSGPKSENANTPTERNETFGWGGLGSRVEPEGIFTRPRPLNPTFSNVQLGHNNNANGAEFCNYPRNAPSFGLTFGSNHQKGAAGSSFHGGNNTNMSRGGTRMPSNSNDEGMSSSSAGFFRTARDELTIQNHKKYGSHGYSNNGGRGGAGGGLSVGQKRSLGTARRAGVHGKFIPPVRPTEEDDFGGMFGVKQPDLEGEEELDERLKNIDPKMVETIRNEIMDIGAAVCWDDIAGLEFAKTTIQEIVVWPLLRPDIFTGLRKPPKGLLLFGPPGTGKTLIGKCIASQSQSTFFSISASSLTSKWIGDGEKMVRALFAVARVHQPSVVFIDEIDSLLTQRSDTEHESSRRLKTEFLVQLDGAATGDEERILVVGATNRPQELDEAARRRLVKRLYIPLPEYPARREIVQRLMSTEQCSLTHEQIEEIASLTEGYSGADMKNLCQEASLGPIRSISFSAMHQITADQVRPICLDDFKSALQRVRPSVSNKDLDLYVQWDKTYGMGSGM